LYTDFPQPTRGSFQESVQRGALDWRSIPRGTRMLSRLGKSAKLRHLGSPNSSYYPTAPIASRSIGKPGLSAVENIGLGVVISVAEADISNEFYEACSNSLNGLLGQVAENHEAVQSEWDAILQRIEQIKAMKLSLPGRIWSWISSVDVLTVQKGNALMLLAGEIADKHGYVLVTSWSDMVDGRPGFFERRSKETY